MKTAGQVLSHHIQLWNIHAVTQTRFPSLRFYCCERHHDYSKSYKGKHLIGSGLKLRGLVHYSHSGNPDSWKADMVLEKKLRILQLDPQAAEMKVTLDIS